ncbi:MAG: microcystin degradation protein MlrC [Alphaproteobacteria bacterium]|nr:microcystin degradation protein MlrC [Alphaproteobacteria bacterium]|tara:strand:- start:1077 stop:2567 length:1491 start_codon:yes stop_codon:yes gene_type:complete
MRFVIAMMKHETNTFSPIATPWARFREWGAHIGDDARRAYENTGMPMGAYLELAREAGADIVTPIAAEAMPSGPVSEEAYSIMTDAICDAVAAGCDAAFLDLHGAMVSETTLDGEGTLLERIRGIAPGLPIAVTCDLHCNLTQRMVDNCTVLIGYKTYPHTDMYDVGLQVGQILMKSLHGELDPVMAWGNRPILGQTLRQGTDDEPMRSLIAQAQEAERSGALAATVFGGFPMADMPEAGLSSIVVTDNDPSQAEAFTQALLDAAWTQREAFVYRGRPLPDSVAHAAELARKPATGGADRPVILLDHADNCGSGGTQDDMSVVAEVLRQGLEDVAVAVIWDPLTVRKLHDAGLDSTVTVALGGNTDMPSIGATGQPLKVTGRVSALTDGDWTVAGPMYTGVQVAMGPTAVLDTGNMEIVIVSRHHEPWDTGVFTSVGIDPEQKTFLLLKSRIHYRAGFADMAKHTITCDGRGVTTSDNDLLHYRNVRRPIYPLDLP